jgi:hypothetical protein
MNTPERQRRVSSRSLLVSGCTFVVVSACAGGETPPPVERVIDVTGFEYAFQAPDTVDPGAALVTFRNSGKITHELILLRLKKGASVSDLVEAHKRDETFRPFLDGNNAVLFGEPGDDSSIPLFVDFEPGRTYVLWCNFTDGEGKPQHSSLGMFKAIHVREGTAVAGAGPAPNELVIDASEYAFHLPDTVPAGITDIRIRNIGQQRHELAFDGLAPGISVAILLSELQKGGNPDSLFAGESAILTAYPGDSSNVSAMRVNLVAWRTYVIGCQFRDTPDARPHFELGMFKEIAVR